MATEYVLTHNLPIEELFPEDMPTKKLREIAHNLPIEELFPVTARIRAP